MGVRERVLVQLDTAARWAGLAPAPEDEPRVIFILVENWEGRGSIEFNDPNSIAAVYLDDEEFFPWEFERLTEPGFIGSRNPGCLLFRVLDKESGSRQVAALIRRDVGLSESEIRGMVGFGVYDPESARIRSNAFSALSWSSDSTRKASRNED